MHTRQSSRALVRLTRIFLGALLLTFGIHASAGPAKPPLELIYATESRLVGGQLIEISPAGRLIFKRQEVFGNATDVPEFIDVGSSARALEIAKAGEQYIFAYTRLGYDKQYPEGITPSRKGTILISSLGLDPALFADTPELRAILKLASSEKGRESKKLRRLLFNTFADGAPALQRLAAGQLSLDTETTDRLSKKEKSILKAASLNESVNPTTRALLITAAADRPADFGDWAAEAILNVLEITPVDGYPEGTADHAGLVLLCFDEASDRNVQVPFVTLTRWLRSSNQLYLERTYRLLQMHFPERHKSALEDAIGDAGSSPATQRFLKGKLREAN